MACLIDLNDLTIIPLYKLDYSRSDVDFVCPCRYRLAVDRSLFISYTDDPRVFCSRRKRSVILVILTVDFEPELEVSFHMALIYGVIPFFLYSYLLWYQDHRFYVIEQKCFFIACSRDSVPGLSRCFICRVWRFVVSSQTV